MLVPVVQVRVVRVRVCKMLVTMPVGVRLARRVIRSVCVLVVLVVGVQMFVLHRFVMVLVLVTLGQVEPDAKAHEHGGDSEANRHPVAQHQNSNQRPNERRDGKVSSSACRAKVSEC